MRQQRNTLSILFYLRRGQTNKNGESSVLCRMTVRGEREAFTTRVFTKPEDWDAKSQRILGRTAKVQEQNRILNDLQVTLTRHYYDIEQRNGYVTAEMIKNAYMGITAKAESLLPIYKEFLEETEALIGIQKSKKTYEKYDRCYRRVVEFLRDKYHVSDIAFRDLKPMFLVDFEVWLATKKNCSTNTIYKFLQLLRMPILKAKRMGIVFKDPYENYKMKKVSVDRGYLTEDEVIAIASHEITIPRLEQVRDIFIFCCYTGLAYSDVAALRQGNIQKMFDGRLWIKCLQNHYRRWTINDLIDACTDALAEYEGRSNPVSRRTFQNDLALMRSDRLGYNAPIVVRDNKYYEYEDPDFSITHLPLNDEGLDALNSALDILRQLQGFPQLASSIDIISKLNEQISRQTGATPPAMDMEHVAGYRGAQFIGTIYDAVRKQQTLTIEYQSFKARQSEKIVVYPYLLKEYRNRWFLICEKATNKAPQVNIFALDRIHSVEIDKTHPFKKCVDFDPEHFFDDTIGVTKSISDRARRVVIKIDRQQAPYVESKPFHKSQKVEQRFRDGSIQLSLKVVINNELERLILGYGGHAEVIAPPEFRDRIAESVRIAAGKYND